MMTTNGSEDFEDGQGCCDLVLAVALGRELDGWWMDGGWMLEKRQKRQPALRVEASRELSPRARKLRQGGNRSVVLAGIEFE